MSLLWKCKQKVFLYISVTVFGAGCWLLAISLLATYSILHSFLNLLTCSNECDCICLYVLMDEAQQEKTVHKTNLLHITTAHTDAIWCVFVGVCVCFTHFLSSVVIVFASLQLWIILTLVYLMVAWWERKVLPFVWACVCLFVYVCVCVFMCTQIVIPRCFVVFIHYNYIDMGQTMLTQHNFSCLITKYSGKSCMK